MKSEKLEEVKNEFIKRNLIPLFNEYKNSKILLPFKCRNHMEKGVQYKSFYSLKRSKYSCNYCSYESLKSNKKYSYDFVKEKYKQNGLPSFISDYKN